MSPRCPQNLISLGQQVDTQKVTLCALSGKTPQDRNAAGSGAGRRRRCCGAREAGQSGTGATSRGLRLRWGCVGKWFCGEWEEKMRGLLPSRSREWGFLHVALHLRGTSASARHHKVDSFSQRRRSRLSINTSFCRFNSMLNYKTPSINCHVYRMSHTCRNVHISDSVRIYDVFCE